MKPKLTVRKCKQCLIKFQQERALQFVCSYGCSIKYQEKLWDKKKSKDWKVKKAIMKEKLLSHSDYLKMFQVVFNTFIRLRDKDKPCISCGTAKDVRYDAGHFYSRKGYSGIRFDEDNVHKQCSNNCNLHLSGNFAEYSIQLPWRIGKQRYDELVTRRHMKLKLSIPEIKDQIKVYKNKIKNL